MITVNELLKNTPPKEYRTYTEKDLEEFFWKYISLVKKKLKVTGEIKKHEKTRPLFAIPNLILELNKKIGELESSEEFGKLIDAAEQFCSAENSEVVAESEHYVGQVRIFSEQPDSTSDYGVCNFLRRSGFYIDTFFGKTKRNDDFFEKFFAELTKTDCTAIYIVPLAEMSFSGKDLDLGDFQIKQFSAQELETIFSNQINRMFYPGAYLNEERLQDLAKHWFLYAEERIPINQFLGLKSGWGDSQEVSFRYTKFPRMIEDICKILILHQSDSVDKRFRILISLTTDDILFGYPRAIAFHDLDQWYRNTQGRWYYYNEELTKEIFESMRAKQILLDHLRGKIDEVDYLGRAFGYSAKALVSDGLDELLSSMIALEALLGEKGEVVNSIARRISVILGKTQRTRKEIQKAFRELYDVRCTLVHGKHFSKKIYVKHLKQVRDMLQKTLLWYVNFLNHLTFTGDANSQKDQIPSRSDILKILDFYYDNKIDVKDLVKRLPDEFPCVEGWIK